MAVAGLHLGTGVEPLPEAPAAMEVDGRAAGEVSWGPPLPLEVPVLTLGGSTCCVLRIDSIATRVADLKAMIERASGIPYAEQELVPDGCPSAMHESCRLAHYPDIFYGNRRIYLLRRQAAAATLDRCTCTRLRRELSLLTKEGEQLRASRGYTLGPAGSNLDENPLHWVAELDGPAGGPYAGGVFRIDIFLPSSYPYRPPRVMFTTRIFHPLVSDAGSIDIDVLHENWSPAVTMAAVLNEVRAALEYPHCPHDICTGCGNPEAALLSRDLAAFDARAREHTQAFALRCEAPRPMEW